MQFFSVLNPLITFLSFSLSNISFSSPTRNQSDIKPSQHEVGYKIWVTMHFRKEIFSIKSCLNLDFNATRNERSWHRNKISMLELMQSGIRSSLLTCLSAVVDVAAI